MTKSDIEAIEELMSKGYVVMINNPRGSTFQQRYTIYQGIDRSKLKAVIINKKNKVVRLQG